MGTSERKKKKKKGTVALHGVPACLVRRVNGLFCLRGATSFRQNHKNSMDSESGARKKLVLCPLQCLSRKLLVEKDVSRKRERESRELYSERVSASHKSRALRTGTSSRVENLFLAAPSIRNKLTQQGILAGQRDREREHKSVFYSLSLSACSHFPAARSRLRKCNTLISFSPILSFSLSPVSSTAERTCSSSLQLQAGRPTESP